MLQAKVGQSVFKRVRFSLKEKKRGRIFLPTSAVFVLIPSVHSSASSFEMHTIRCVFYPFFILKRSPTRMEATVWDTFSTLFSFSCFSFELILGMQYTWQPKQF